MKVPVNEPLISDEAKQNVIDALNTGWISSSGKYVEEFEKNFAEYLGVAYAVTTSNGTTALHTALIALGIGPDDEVIVPAFTMISTIFAVMYTGAKPVFIDCELDTYNIDPARIEEKITSRTKALLPVHIYGHPCDMDAIHAIAERHKLLILEDAAEVHGAEYKGKKCGTLSDIAAFSFYGNKIITTGEGGMVVTNNKALAEKARHVKDLHHSAKRFIHNGLGYNYRLTNLQAALGVGELQHIQEYIEHKQWMAREYKKGLNGVRGLRLPITKPYATNVYWMYAVLVDPNVFGMTKDEIRAKLLEAGIDTRDFFYAPSEQPILKQAYGDVGSYKNTEYIGKNGFYVPSGLAITQEQIDYVCAQVRGLQV